MRVCRPSAESAGRFAVSLIVPTVLVFGASYAQNPPPARIQPGRALVGEMLQPQPPKQFRGRLPAYYSSVVDERQRQRIYDIQRRYFLQIEDLKAQLESVTKRCHTEVAAVLSPQQQAEVRRLEAEAKAKRDAKKKVPPR